jgi:hypothetical protein
MTKTSDTLYEYGHLMGLALMVVACTFLVASLATLLLPIRFVAAITSDLKRSN